MSVSGESDGSFASVQEFSSVDPPSRQAAVSATLATPPRPHAPHESAASFGAKVHLHPPPQLPPPRTPTPSTALHILNGAIGSPRFPAPASAPQRIFPENIAALAARFSPSPSPPSRHAASAPIPSMGFSRSQGPFGSYFSQLPPPPSHSGFNDAALFHQALAGNYSYAPATAVSTPHPMLYHAHWAQSHAPQLPLGSTSHLPRTFHGPTPPIFSADAHPALSRSSYYVAAPSAHPMDTRGPQSQSAPVHAVASTHAAHMSGYGHAPALVRTPMPAPLPTSAPTSMPGPAPVPTPEAPPHPAPTLGPAASMPGPPAPAGSAELSLVDAATALQRKTEEHFGLIRDKLFDDQNAVVLFVRNFAEQNNFSVNVKWCLRDKDLAFSCVQGGAPRYKRPQNESDEEPLRKRCSIKVGCKW